MTWSCLCSGTDHLIIDDGIFVFVNIVVDETFKIKQKSNKLTSKTIAHTLSNTPEFNCTEPFTLSVETLPRTANNTAKIMLAISATMPLSTKMMRTNQIVSFFLPEDYVCYTEILHVDPFHWLRLQYIGS